MDQAEGSFIADIGIKDGYIKAIGENLKPDTSKIIDAKGYIVSPGFIDIDDSHSDFSLLQKSQSCKAKYGKVYLQN